MSVALASASACFMAAPAHSAASALLRAVQNACASLNRATIFAASADTPAAFCSLAAARKAPLAAPTALHQLVVVLVGLGLGREDRHRTDANKNGQSGRHKNTGNDAWTLQGL